MLAGGTGLNMKIEMTRRGMKQRSDLDVDLADSTDVVTHGAAVDRAVLLELIKTNLGNKALREFV